MGDDEGECDEAAEGDDEQHELVDGFAGGLNSGGHVGPFQVLEGTALALGVWCCVIQSATLG
ncbi:hypothetical protein ABT158_48550 [Nonomuraea sp. NPDC001636]|uniref:hypothetical protein n=1 Tax=Nonomuraea sp. NPDC001636 TaxID=3154391 RepID=UPI00331A0966